jgi:dsRNA-specific ribonuclease
MSDPRSVDQIKNNERLEFLGDAILDAVVAEILFKQFPNKNEGFLTEMRTRIVNREQLGYLASKLGLVEIMDIKRDLHSNKIAMKTIGGNALEALIGAIYLDKGFLAAREFVSQRLVGQYLDMEKLMATAVSHKALVMKWAQQNHKVLRFDSESQVENRNDLHSVRIHMLNYDRCYNRYKAISWLRFEEELKFKSEIMKTKLSTISQHNTYTYTYTIFNAV